MSSSKQTGRLKGRKAKKSNKKTSVVADEADTDANGGATVLQVAKNRSDSAEKDGLHSVHKLAVVEKSGSREPSATAEDATYAHTEVVAAGTTDEFDFENCNVDAQNFISHLEQGCVILDLHETNARDIISAIVTTLVEESLLKAHARDEVEECLQNIEKEHPHAVGCDFDVLTASVSVVEQPVYALVRLAKPVNFLAPDGLPTRFIVVAISKHFFPYQLESFSEGLLFFMENDTFRKKAWIAKSRSELLQLMKDLTRGKLKKTDENYDDLQSDLICTKKFAGGLLRDLKVWRRRLKSDIFDGLRAPVKSLTTIVFLTVACLTPNVAFGGLVADACDGQIGVMEMLISSAVAGLFYAIFSAQPLVILGGSGPYLIFVQILYQVCQSLELQFLPFYAWTGLWCTLILVIFVLTDASSLIRHTTRFTNEVFGALIGGIFVYEAVVALLKGFTNEHRLQTDSVAMLTFILGFGTFAINKFLRNLRSSPFLLRVIRELIADFGAIIAIGIMIIFDYVAVPAVSTKRLSLPEGGIRPSVERDWLVSLGDIDAGIVFLAIIPGFLLAILVYLNNNITTQLLQQKDNALAKPGGLHLDLLCQAIIIGVASLFGFPWILGATVRTLNHHRALAVIEETPSGKSIFLSVIEQRVTGICIGVLLLLAIFAASILKYVPIAPLYGLLLFMGVASISTNQFVDRLLLVITEPSLRPPSHYSRKVKAKRIFLYTFIQLVAFVLLWVVKSTVVGLAFPLVTALLIPFRLKMLPKWFTKEELNALDASKTINVGEPEPHR